MGAHRFASVLLAVSLFAACGDDDSSGTVDSNMQGSDSMQIDTPMQQGNCDFTETADTTNNNAAGAEPTGKTLATTLSFCGALDTGHQVADLVDSDVFHFTVAADTDVLLHVNGAGLETLEEVGILITDLSGDALDTDGGFGRFEGTHGTTIAHLPAGTWLVAVSGFNATAPGAATDYRLTVVKDDATARCAKITATADYTEVDTGNTANDVITYALSQNPESQFTASGTDAPEVVGFTVAPSTKWRITGNSAAVTNPDNYQDRDTFAIVTGATTNQMTVRANWVSTSTDLDMRMYFSTGAQPISYVGGLNNANAEDELETFAVKPSTTYWLWVAGYDGSSATAYDLTICGETWSP